MSCYDDNELAALGFAGCGENVRLSRKASIYGAGNITIGSNVRIDDFCILSAGEGGISIGSFVHVAAYSSLIGAATITLGDFSNLSSRVSIYSSSDDYSGRSMTNPMVPDEYKRVDNRPVSIGRHVIIGCGSVILPGVTLGESCAIGALSLVNQECRSATIYAGNPLREIRQRSSEHLSLEKEFLDQRRGDGSLRMTL